MPEAFTTTTFNSPSTLTESDRDMSYRPNGDGAENESGITPPLSYYQKVNKETYTEHFFKISNTDFTEEITIIENYIFKQIENLRLEDSTDSYEEIINKIIDKLEISKNEVTKSKIEKIINYINLLSRNLTKEERITKMHQKKEDSDARINKLKSLI